ncbi:WxL domain surface protein (plasmid) [Enterococcus mundtii]|uniref:WxL domain surface protein n=1 Tax=Enterococcus mundtii TaxID=53346 RepID=A0AAI8RCT4_ENTMU|nr:WxL domain-containing protein [Enterococcus mundtii]BBM16279.1 WxL domain surface protein [Enterococcus mundtii]
MTTRLRRPMLVLGTTLLIIQAVFMPVGMVYAETTMDIEEQELMELPPMKNYLEEELMELPPMKNYLEEELISDPRFFFTRSRMQGTAEESLQVTFFSDQEVSEARVFLPEEATLLKDQLPTGTSVEEGAQPNEWIVQSERAQNTFVLPLVFGEAGNYELSVEETTAHLEISEKEETSEEVPVEAIESSEDYLTEQEELKEENGIEEEEENEQPVEEVREPESEAPQEQQTNEEETDEATRVAEPTVFDGETAAVATMAEFREAVGNPDIGIISVQANLTAATEHVLTVDRPLLIQGNGYTLTFGINAFYFQLEEVTQASTIRLENATLTKVGVTPLIISTVESSKNWTVELEDITEVNANTMRLASLPEGSIHFTGGVSNFTRTTSAQMFIEAKEVLATNQAEVTISRGNTTVFFSSATVADPKLTVEQGATVTITTTAGTANTIDLRGKNPEIALQNGNLSVSTIGLSTGTIPTNSTNNAVVLSGTVPKITVHQDSLFTVRTTLTKRGIHLVGDNAQLEVNNSNLSVVSATQAALNIAGESPRLVLDSSNINITSTTGPRINLIGANPLLSLASTEMIMNASTGQGIHLQGTTPQVKLDNSQLLVTDTSASQGMILQGTDALLSLSNKSELSIIGAGTGSLQNIQIGTNAARPKLLIEDSSKLLINTGSTTTVPTVSSSNQIHVWGADANVTIQSNATLKTVSTVGWQTGLRVTGTNSLVTVNSGNIYTENSNLFFTDVESVLFENNSTIDLFMNRRLRIPLDTRAHLDGYSSLIYIDSQHIEINILTQSVMRIENDFGQAITTNIDEIGVPIIKFVIDDSEVDISGGTEQTPLIWIQANELEFVLRNQANVNMEKIGTSVAWSAQAWNSPNVLSLWAAGSNPNINFQIENSSLNLQSDNGVPLYLVNRAGSTGTHLAKIVIKEGSSFQVISKKNYAIVYHLGSRAGLDYGIFELNNPLFYEIESGSNLPGIAVLGTPSNVDMSMIGENTKLSLWRKSGSRPELPDLSYSSSFNFEVSGLGGLTTVIKSTDSNFNNTILGSSGLSEFSKLSATNARWAIADELRVPTNADKKIHGRVSIPVRLGESRPAVDDEAIVTVEVESPLGEKKKEYTGTTVGHTNGSPGISIYGEEPRGGLFEIDLEEPLEAGSKVRISKVELTSGELMDGFEHQILTDTVEVFPIIPPTPAQFSSSIIAQDSTTIQGMTDNLDAEVSATHNGEPLNTEKVTVEADGRFTLDLSEISLEMDDEIQVFLRDTEGSAKEAGVINPPETNNNRGNINPVTEFTFHDVTFEPATILIVGDMGPVSPVDPLDPEIDVNPENQPQLPEDQGLLSIDFISSFTFGSQAISAQTKRYYAQPQRLLNLDGTLNDAEERPNYIQVSDRRPENERKGWTLAVTQNNQFMDRQGNQLRGAHLVLNNQQFASVQENGEPTLQNQDGAVLIPEQKMPLVTARNGQGAGTWIYRFGDGESAGESVALEVPPTADPRTTTYQTTLTWELSAVPDN